MNAPEKIWATTGLYYEYVQDWSEGEWQAEKEYAIGTGQDETVVPYTRSDVAQAMVAAAYLDAANLHQSLWRETSAYKTDQILKRTPADARAALDAILSQASAEGFDRGVKEAQPIVESLRAELKALYDIIGYDMLDLESTPVAALDALLAKAREDALREALCIIGGFDEASDCPSCCDVTAINEAVTALIDRTAEGEA